MKRPHSRSLALVIDDASEVLARAFEKLEARGYRVATRRTVMEGFQYAIATKPDLVLIGEPLWKAEIVEKFRRHSPQSHIRRLPALSLEPTVSYGSGTTV